MAIAEAATGTQAATVGTEHSLTVISPAGKSYMLVPDFTNMANGDEVELRAKVKVLSGGTRRLLDFAVFQHTQPEAIVIFGPYPAAHDIEFTLKQTAGTGRSFDWGVWSA